MNAIIFGSSGQDGYYLTRLLKEKGVSVVCVSRSGGDAQNGDVSDFSFVEKMIKDHHPVYVFHLAANSTTRHDALFENHQTISTGTLNILESVRTSCPSAKVFLSGSAMQFVNHGLPINELTPFEASSSYSVARIQSVYAGRYYRNHFGLKVYVGFFFNHDSPLRTETHVNQKIVCAIKRIANGSIEKLELGNINVNKEFNFAGDMVDAIWMLINQNKVFEVVIGSGKSYSIQDWLDYCFGKINKNWRDYVVIKEDFKSEYSVLVSDPSLMKSLGWVGKVTFEQLADLMMGM